MSEKNMIENPATREKIFFRRTGKDTNGELLEFDMIVSPGGFVTAEHMHPGQTEHFIVQEGNLLLKHKGELKNHHDGGEATIEPGTRHVWWNDGDSDLRVRVDFRPADQFSHFLTSLFALVQDGKTNKRGMPNPLQLAVMIQKYGHVIYPSRPPRAIQNVLFSILAPVARMLGYKPDHPYPRDK